jgi:undecaprenyl-diphosphatase
MVGVLAWLAAFVVLTSAVVGLGLVLVHVVLPAGLERVDASVSRWLLDRREPSWDTVTAAFSDLSSVAGVLAILGLSIGVLSIGRHWREIGFLVSALALEFAVFLTSSYVVSRDRPAVPRLDPEPPTGSYPSGHVAASIVLFVGLSIIVFRLTRSSVARTTAVVLALALPVLVAHSRLYRGMHHLSDLVGSLLLSAGALLLAWLVVALAVSAKASEDEEAPDPIAGH